MQNNESIRCRVVACRESLEDGNEWSFYLINDSDICIDLAVLEKIGYEWSDIGKHELVDVSVTDLEPGSNMLIWRDDGSGAELRMDFSLRVQARGHEKQLQFEFPKLYRKRDLPIVEGLGKPGWQVVAETTIE